MPKLKFKLSKAPISFVTSVVALLLLCFGIYSTTVNHKPYNSAGINEQINFQGRLLTNTGAVVPDGTYNIRFKIYQDGDGVLGGGDESLKWTETRESGNKVVVKNGYFSVYLGSVTALTGIDWNQSVLWLSVDIGGTGSPSYDGEMTPFNRLGATPYALNAKQLGGIASTGYVQIGPSAAQGDASNNNSIFINKTTGTGNILELQKSGTDVFNIANNGAIVSTYTSTSSTAGTEYAHTLNLTDTGAVTTGTDESRGLNVNVTRTGASSSAVTTLFGVYSLALGDTGGTSTAIGVEGVAGGADTNYAVAGAGVTTGSATLTETTGVIGSITSASFTGTATAVNAIQSAIDISTAGTYSTATGILSKTATLSGGGAITTLYGGWFQTQTVGGTNYTLRVDTAAGAGTNQTLWIAGNDASATTASKGIAFGSAKDTTLYRGGSNTLQTDGDLYFNTGGTRTIKVLDSTTGAGNTFAITGAGGLNGGANLGGALTLTGGTGGNSTGIGIGGAGGALNLNGGATASSNWQGAAGGAVNISGATPVASVAATGATGGAVNISGGTGGSATGFASSGAAAGGAVAITAGSGGTAAGGGNQTGGGGANVTLTAGSGGTSIGSAANSNGGSITIQGGSAGTGGGGAAGTAGNISLQVATGATINVGANGVANTVQIGNTSGAVTQTINVGNNATASSVTTLVLGSAISTSSTTINAGTGNLAIGNNGVANTIQIGNTTGAVQQTINLGTNATASSSTPVNIGSTIGSSKLTLNAGTFGVDIANNGISNTLQIGNANNAVNQTINIGNNSNASGSTTVIVGCSAGACPTTLQAGSSGLFIGNAGVSNTIQIGNTTGAVAQTTNIGNNATASSTNNVNIGSSVAGTVAITGPTTVTGRTSGSGTALTVGNSTSTGSIAVFNDNATAVLTIADGGAVTLQNQTNVATAFKIMDSGTEVLLTADTTARGAGGGNLIKIGNSTGTDTNLTILKLDAATADPTSNLAALNGGLFYDSANNKVKIIENGTVKTVCNTTDAGCGAGGATTLQSAYAATSGNTITATDGRDLAFTFADTTTDPNFIINLQCVTSCSTNGRFAIQSAGTDVFTVAPTGNITATKHIAVGASGSISNCPNLGGACSSIINTQETFTSTSTSIAGTYTDITLNPSGAETAAANVAGNFQIQTQAGNAQNFSGFYDLIGTYAGSTHHGSGTVGTAMGSYIGVQNDGGGTLTNAAGQYIVMNNSSGTIGTGYGIYENLGFGTATTAYAIQLKANSGTITNNYGINVEAQTAGTSDYGVRIDAADTQTLWLSGNADSVTAAAGIAFGQTVASQANLYRGGNNLLKTDSSLQVGSAAGSGDVNVFGDISKKGVKKITALANINDVFVYDTTRDSDGGAWTNSPTSQGLSWYTESKDDGPGDACNIASDDRCDGSRFPAKAIIVSTPDAVYIFDSVDYKLFMKFSQNASGYALGVDTNNNPSGVFALNGVVYVGTNGTAGTGMYALDFTQDRMFSYNSTNRSQGDKNISNRNSAVTYNVNAQTSWAIPDNKVNDVHGAVLTGSASAVAATTIPEHGTTFIALATDTGAAVINMQSGKELDYADNATDDVNQVWLTRRGILYLTNETLAQVERYNTIDTDTADQITPDDIFDETTANTPNLAKTTPTMSTSPDALQVVEQSSLAAEYNATTITSGDVIYVGHSQGLTEIHNVVTASATNIGWSKFYKTGGETALMSGTPRGMFGFNEASGDAIDDTIRANVLEAKGTPTRQVNGVHGFGARFNGTSQYFCSDANNDATCDTDADYDPALISFHVEAWFKHSTTMTGTDTLIDHTYTTTPALAAGYRIYMNSTGTISAGIDDDGTAFDDDIITTTPTYNDGQWHHVVFERVSTALTNPAQAIGIYLYIDGRSVGSDTTIAATLTLNSSALLGIGADCSVGAACATGANFWDGDIDDVYISMGGATSSDSLNAPAGTMRRKFLEGRAALLKPSTTITDATTATSTTLGKTGQTYVPNEFVGTTLEITGGTGAGQTRRVIANDATTFTVSPAFTSTPDTTSDYEIVPEQLYGSSDSVTSIGITDNDFLGRTRTMYVGTNNGSDGGGVTAFQGYGTPSATSVFHSDAGITDDSSTSWTGTDADDIQSVEARGGLVMLGSLQGLWMQRDDRNVDSTLDQIINDLASIRQELTIDGLNGMTSEFSNVGTGADLAERYSSIEDLTAGDVVSLEKNNAGSVKKSTLEYDPELLGIVATEPAITIGPKTETTHPIALSGRVPVKVIQKQGEVIKSGDRITSSSIAGYGTKASKAGRVLGTVLEDLSEDKLSPCPTGVEPSAKCGVITVFVNLTDFNGENIEVAIDDFEGGGLTLPDSILDPVSAWIDVQDEAGVTKDKVAQSDKALRYLLARKQAANEKPQSEVLTDRLSAFDINGVNIFAKDIVAGTLTVDKIRANKIEGLEILTDKIDALGRSSTPDNQAATPTDSTTTAKGVSFKSVTISEDLSISGTLFANGGLKVAGPVEFLNTTVFHKLATFVEKTIFNNDVEFNGQVSFNKDTAGFAIIHPGQQEVVIKFDKPYPQPPVVNITRKNAIFTDYAYKDLKPDGFTIVLKEPATQDVEFAWSALEIKDAKTIHVPVAPAVAP